MECSRAQHIDNNPMGNYAIVKIHTFTTNPCARVATYIHLIWYTVARNAYMGNRKREISHCLMCVVILHDAHVASYRQSTSAPTSPFHLASHFRQSHAKAATEKNGCEYNCAQIIKMLFPHQWNAQSQNVSVMNVIYRRCTMYRYYLSLMGWVHSRSTRAHGYIIISRFSLSTDTSSRPECELQNWSDLMSEQISIEYPAKIDNCSCRFSAAESHMDAKNFGRSHIASDAMLIRPPMRFKPTQIAC